MKPQSAIACASVSTTLVCASTDSAPEARAVASACGNWRGRTSTSDSSPMFFIARATAPMFPGCEGSTSTMRMLAALEGMRSESEIECRVC